MKKELAEETSLLALKMSSTLNKHLIKIQNNCGKEDFDKMRKGIGYVMGYLYTDVMEPLWEMHPDLKPEDMDGTYKVPPETYE